MHDISNVMEYDVTLYPEYYAYFMFLFCFVNISNIIQLYFQNIHKIKQKDKNFQFPAPIHCPFQIS